MLHMPTKGPFVDSEDSLLWSQRIMVLTSYDIVWHNIIGGKEIISICGEFPNVPLIGTKDYINYNPILVRRQLGYVMTDKPTDREVEETVYFGKGEDRVLLKKVRVAWSHIHNKGITFFGQRGCLALDLYVQWIQN